MNWSGGEFRGFAGMIINSGANLNISNTVGIKGNNLITNNGTATWASGSTIQYGAGGTNAQIQNNGVSSTAALVLMQELLIFLPVQNLQVQPIRISQALLLPTMVK